jgi:hypothetical protein
MSKWVNEGKKEGGPGREGQRSDLRFEKSEERRRSWKGANLEGGGVGGAVRGQGRKEEVKGQNFVDFLDGSW